MRLPAKRAFYIRDYIKREAESLNFAVQEQAIRTNAKKARIRVTNK